MRLHLTVETEPEPATVLPASSQAMLAAVIGLIGNAIAIPAENISDGAADAAAAMLIHGA